MIILSFQSKNDPETCLEWEMKVELIFECHNYCKEKKVKLEIVKFMDYAIIWWDQIVQGKRRHHETYWDLGIVEDHHEEEVHPSHYHKELYQKLQSLTQGFTSVEDGRDRGGHDKSQHGG